jgi:Protein of unknown function (DUF2911)
MKNILAVLFVCVCISVQAQIETPQASSAGSVSSRVGLTDIKIDYFRPKLKNRKIFGEGTGVLLPYGQIWRTGANSGTRITFSDDVKVEGKPVVKGTYMIFTIPGASEWKVMLYSDLTIGGNTQGYDKAKEVASVSVKSEKITEKIETFTISIGDISDDNTLAKVQIAWENTSVKFAVTVDYETRVMSAIDANTKVNPDNLMAAAHFYYDNKKDLKLALAWVNAYFADGSKNDEFYNWTFKARIQQGLGDKAGALATAQKSLDIARKAPNDFGYIKQNEDLIKALK